MSKRTENRKLRPRQAGFSLVEVCLALMVVAIGLLILMAMFPSGLKEAESAAENTRASLFADDKFNELQANAMLVETIAEFQLGNTIFSDTPTNSIETSTANGNALRWKCLTQLNTTVPSTPVWRVRLEVKNGVDGPFSDPVVFYTELVFGAPRP